MRWCPANGRSVDRTLRHCWDVHGKHCTQKKNHDFQPTYYFTTHGHSHANHVGTRVYYLLLNPNLLKLIIERELIGCERFCASLRRHEDHRSRFAQAADKSSSKIGEFVKSNGISKKNMKPLIQNTEKDEGKGKMIAFANFAPRMVIFLYHFQREVIG